MCIHSNSRTALLRPALLQHISCTASPPKLQPLDPFLVKPSLLRHKLIAHQSLGMHLRDNTLCIILHLLFHLIYSSLLLQSHSFFKAHIYQLLGLVSHAGAQIKHRERFWGLSAVARTSYFSHQHRFHRISAISKKSTSLGGERLWKDVTKLRIAPQQGLGFDGDGYTARGLSYI